MLSATAGIDQPVDGKGCLPKILILCGTYLPGFKAGGHLRSIETLVAALGNEFEFRIVTLDRDLGDKSPFPGIVVNSWVPVGQAEVMYLRPGMPSLLRIWALLRSVGRNTVLYLNGFFPRCFSMLPVLMWWLKLSRPKCVVLEPNGEFSPGALQIKPTRKRVYIGATRLIRLYDGLLWHASSSFEAEDIRRQFPSSKRIAIAEVIPSVESDRTRGANHERTLPGPASVPARKEHGFRMPGELHVVFLSRLARKKNLAGALRMLEGLSGNVAFDIFGPTEDLDYWEECQKLIAALPDNIRVQYRGEVEHERIGQVFAEHDLFLFPTHGENYGHVIYEALASGCPVLISDQTPWRNLEAEGVGWDIPLGETERFRSVLQQCVDGDDEWFSALSKRAVNYAIKRASDPKTLDANRKLFQFAFAWPNPR